MVVRLSLNCEVFLRTLILNTAFLMVAACGTAPMEYQPSEMNLDDAIGEVEQQIMTQHPAWRPDYVHFDSQYMLLGFGTRTTGSGSSTLVGNTVIGGGSSTTRAVGDRIYFEEVSGVELRSWMRKMRQWYAVSILNLEGGHAGYLLRTRDLQSAQRFVDAMTVMLDAYNENPTDGLVASGSVSESDFVQPADIEVKSDLYTQLLELTELKERGILSDEEFESQKKKLLESE